MSPANANGPNEKLETHRLTYHYETFSKPSAAKDDRMHIPTKGMTWNIYISGLLTTLK